MLRKTTFQGQSVYELSEGSSKVLVAPQAGARLLNWHVGDKPVIYWPEEANWSKPAHVRGGNPILFPFAARHMVDGVIGWWLDATGKKRAMPMHGFARDTAFAVIEESDPNMLRMRIEATPVTREFYPFDFTFDVVYRLQGTKLESRLEVTNKGTDPMPYYMGHHFYFVVPHTDRAQWAVKVPCARWGRQSADGSIAERPAASDVTLLTDADLSDRFQIEFKSSEISILKQKTGQGVVIDLNGGGNVPWYEATTWTEKADSDFYCLEPWTGLPNAIHHGKGLRYVAPGSKESAVCFLNAR
jgi:galactose mutarotase-like enzyme